APARVLCYDLRGVHGDALRVATHALAVPAGRERRVQDAPAVHQHPVVLADLTQRAEHRDVARVVDVEAMDLGDRRGADADLHDARTDELEESLTLIAREHLRILHAADELRI